MDAITVREATLADYPALRVLFDEIQQEHVDALPHIFQMPDGPARPRRYVATLLADPDIALFVAERRGRVIGVIDVRIQHSPDNPILVPRRYAMVDTLVVRKRSRRHGAGRALMARAHEWACERGISEVQLSVWEVNAGAVAFYEALGYTTAHRRMWIRIGERAEEQTDAKTDAL